MARAARRARLEATRLLVLLLVVELAQAARRARLAVHFQFPAIFSDRARQALLEI